MLLYNCYCAAGVYLTFDATDSLDLFDEKSHGNKEEGIEGEREREREVGLHVTLAQDYCRGAGREGAEVEEEEE